VRCSNTPSLLHGFFVQLSRATREHLTDRGHVGVAQVLDTVDDHCRWLLQRFLNGVPARLVLRVVMAAPDHELALGVLGGGRQVGLDQRAADPARTGQFFLLRGNE
jgi:hypothetical protein